MGDHSRVAREMLTFQPETNEKMVKFKKTTLPVKLKLYSFRLNHRNGKTPTFDAKCKKNYFSVAWVFTG